MSVPSHAVMRDWRYDKTTDPNASVELDVWAVRGQYLLPERIKGRN